MVQSFRDLLMWQKGMDLAVLVYKASEKFPRSEMFGLSSQVRRAVVSKRLEMLSPEEADYLITRTSEVGKMLTSLLNALPKD